MAKYNLPLVVTRQELMEMSKDNLGWLLRATRWHGHINMDTLVNIDHPGFKAWEAEHSRGLPFITVDV